MIGEALVRLEGKVAIVTGAASGMGAAIARRFAREGARVVLADILDTEGVAVTTEITMRGGRAIFDKLDVADEEGWRTVLASTIHHFGKLDILVNNAGISGGMFRDIFDSDGWNPLLDINAKGVFLGMKYAIPEMARIGGGSIVNLSSISGNVGQVGVHLGYTASKSAVRMMTKSAALQFGAQGIRVNSVHPGLLPPMRTSKSVGTPEHRREILRRVPLGRSGEVDEVANAVLFLASDEASYISGAELPVDGGYLTG